MRTHVTSLKASLLGALLVGLLPGGSARADEKSTCLTSYVDGQALRKEERLRAAASTFRVCAQPACPVRLSQNCLIWLREVESEIPSVVVSVTQGGKPRTDLRVEIDGELTATSLDGKAIPVDPGQRRVRVVGEGVDVTRTIATKKSEGPREVRIDVAAEAAPAQTERPVPAVVWPLAGLAVVGAGVWGYFGVRGLNERSDLFDCKAAGNCEESAINRAHDHLVLADVGLGISVVAAAAATYFFLTRPSRPAATTTEAAR